MYDDDDGLHSFIRPCSLEAGVIRMMKKRSQEEIQDYLIYNFDLMYLEELLRRVPGGKEYDTV
jgi:N-acetylglutamate synthase-like GNAT family acetyltransferase